MPPSKLNFQAGVYKDDSPLKAKGFWVDADKIRFVRGQPETIYGWEKASSSSLLGICRGMLTWADNGRNPFAAFGTHLRVYVMDVDGNVTDITPVASYGQLTNPFTTDGTTSTITVAHTAHGLATSQAVTWPTVSAINGATITPTALYAVTVVDANTYTFSADTVSTSSGSGVGGTVDYWYRLAVGQSDGLGGLGFGTGGFGSGGFGGSASGYTLYPRTFSMSQWGQNLIFNPRGGGLYEFAPNVTATELVTNGTFTGAATGWALGAGWAYSANTVVATASGAAITQTITLPAGAWCRLQFDVPAFTGGTIQASVGGTNVGSSVGATGRQFISFFTGGGGAKVLALTGTGLTATIDNVSVQVQTYGQLITNAPTQVTCSFVTPERILFACGCADVNGNFDALRVRWTDTQNNQTWTAAGSNLAGSYTLSNGSRIVRGMHVNREGVILTDNALYAVRYVPDPNVVYTFTEIADKCGLIGPNAVAKVGGIIYWMDPAGGFWSYDGSFPQALECTLGRDTHDNLSNVQQDKVYGFPVTLNGRVEIWWLIPDIRDGNECSRYVSYQVTESAQLGAPVWTCGTFTRTAWSDGAAPFTFPIAVDVSGSIWFHEKGFTQDGASRSFSLTSSYYDLADGQSSLRIKNMLADTKGLQGGVSITLNTRIRNTSGILTRSFGPYSMNAASGKINMRANGQEVQLVYTGSGAPLFWRRGAESFEFEQSGRSR